jgi:5-deoxy-D-glucuronate isomerase
VWFGEKKKNSKLLLLVHAICKENGKIEVAEKDSCNLEKRGKLNLLRQIRAIWEEHGNTEATLLVCSIWGEKEKIGFILSCGRKREMVIWLG